MPVGEGSSGGASDRVTLPVSSGKGTEFPSLSPRAELPLGRRSARPSVLVVCPDSRLSPGPGFLGGHDSSLIKADFNFQVDRN